MRLFFWFFVFRLFSSKERSGLEKLIKRILQSFSFRNICCTVTTFSLTGIFRMSFLISNMIPLLWWKENRILKRGFFWIIVVEIFFLVSKNVDVVWRWEFSFDLCGIILCIDIQLGWVFLGYCWFLNSIDVCYFGSYWLNWSLSWYHYFCFAYLIGKRYLLFCFDLVGYFTFFRLLI